VDEIDLNVSADNTSAPVGESEVADDLSLASPFLSKIPANDRAIVGRYVKDWDAGVTKKFQEYSGKLKPYEALGPVDELIKFRNLAMNLRTNPEMVFKIMWDGFQEQYGDEFDAQLPRILGLEEEMTDQDYNGESEEWEGSEESDPNEQFQQNVMQELEELRAWREEQETAALQAEENQQFETVLAALHQKFGDFDDDGVTVRIAAHGDPVRAVQEWRQMVSKYSQNGAQRQAPKVMGGQGGVPSEKVDTNALRGAERKAAVMNMLAGLQDDQ
jgi:hypothetical protein